MTALLEAKKQSMTDRQGELAKVRATAAELSKSVTDLNELIAKLDTAVTSGTGLGAYDAETRAKMADTPQVSPPAPASGVTEATVAVLPPKAPANDKVAVLTPPPAPIKPSVVELAPAAMSLGGANPGRLKPAIAFHEARARLAHAGPRPPRARIRRQNPIRRPIQRDRHRNPAGSPDHVALRRLDRLRRRIPQLRPAIDHQRRWWLSCSFSWLVANRRTTWTICTCVRTCRNNERNGRRPRQDVQCPGPLRRI